MRSRGWLDEARVWRSSADSFDTVIQLRPLHRYDLPGVLAAELPGGFLVEYRPKERWDAAFDHSAVFVHSFQDNHSYVMRGTNGNFDLTAGDSFARGKQAGLFSVLAGSTKMDVVAIDDHNKTATIRLVHRSPFIEPLLVGSVTAGVAAGGSGLIFVGGKFRPVPPRGLANTILEGVAAYLDAAEITDSNPSRPGTARNTRCDHAQHRHVRRQIRVGQHSGAAQRRAGKPRARHRVSGDPLGRCMSVQTGFRWR
jgi:hypothetical protein